MENCKYNLTRDYKKFPLKDLEYPPKEDMIEVYITKNTKFYDACAVFGICKAKFQRALRMYGIVKSVELQQQNSRATNIAKYGVENPLQSKDFREKCRETVKKRYGVSNPFQVPEFIKKSKETCLKKYGSEYVGRIPEFQAKRQATIRAKYGAKTGMQCHMHHLDIYNDDTQFSDFVKAGKDGRKWYR